MTAPHRNAERLRDLERIVEHTDAGHHYRWALGLEPRFAQMLVDGGYVEIREEDTHPLGGPAHHMYATNKGRALLARWLHASGTKEPQALCWDHNTCRDVEQCACPCHAE
jgi:hypothetical protein